MESKSADQSIASLNSASEFFEIASAAALAICFMPLVHVWLVVVSVSGLLLFLLSIVFRLKGGARETRAAGERENELWAGWHVVTEQRLKTLEVVEVESDIREALSLRLNKPALPARKFIAELEQALGRERTQEKLQVVLYYTRTSEPSPSAVQPDQHEEQPPATAGRANWESVSPITLKSPRAIS
jgi:hypothetical protein